MKNIKTWSLALIVLASYNCKEVKKDADKASDTMEMEEATTDMNDDMMGEVLTLNMQSKSNSAVNGEITFEEEDGEVKMKAVFSGLDEGPHAIHLHENSDCSSADGKSAGGHWNPMNQPHGKWGDEKGYHKGDIGNFTADAEGNATVEFATEEWCMGCDDENKNIIGRSVIVHKGQDDFTSQPSGDAGARVACTGIIE